MARKLMIVSVLMFSVTLFSGLASAMVTGSWDVAGTLKVKASIKKAGSGSQAGTFVDFFVFDPDTSFHMIDIDGTWSQSKTKFKVFLNPAEIASYLETTVEDAVLLETGYVVDVFNVTVTKNKFTGSEGKSGNTISGQYNLAVRFSVYVFAYGIELTGSATAAVKYSGMRSFPLSPLGNSKTVEVYRSPDGMDALLRPLVDAIMRSVLTPDADLPH